MLPKTTRLRWVSAKDKNLIVKYCDTLGRRIEIYEIVYAGNEWVMWFVPDDKGADLPSGMLTPQKQNKK
jgi:hypothetical protein